MPTWTSEQLNQTLLQGRVTLAPSVPAGRPLQNPKPERPVRDEPLAAPQGEAPGPGRVHVRITSRRRRLIDPDNLVGKWITDCLRYGGYLREDDARHISYEIRQEKWAQDETIVEIFAHETPMNETLIQCPSCGHSFGVQP